MTFVGLIRAGSLLPIEDPFELARDLGGMLTLGSLEATVVELERARDRIAAERAADKEPSLADSDQALAKLVAAVSEIAHPPPGN